MSHFLHIFSEKFVETSKGDSFLEKFVPNWSFFMVFHETSQFLQLFSEKFIQMSKHDSLLEKLPVLAKSMIFHGFSRNE